MPSACIASGIHGRAKPPTQRLLGVVGDVPVVLLVAVVDEDPLVVGQEDKDGLLLVRDFMPPA